MSRCVSEARAWRGTTCATSRRRRRPQAQGKQFGSVLDLHRRRCEFAADRSPGKQVVAAGPIAECVHVDPAFGIAREGESTPLLKQRTEAQCEAGRGCHRLGLSFPKLLQCSMNRL